MKPDYPVTLLGELLGVSRSGYYAWCRRGRCRRQRQDVELTQQILQIHAASRGTYGSPRVQWELQERGCRIGRRRIMRLMRVAHVQGRRRRRWRPATTDSRHTQTIAPNLLAQWPVPPRANAVWVADATCVWTSEGWLYVAGVLDAFSRRLVGWAFGPSLSTALCLQALAMARLQRRPPPGLLHHSDRGVQYASGEYRRRLAAFGGIASMSRSGHCYDNATMESFWSTLKNDCVAQRRFATRQQASVALFDYIETFYNRSRRHSSLGYQSPVAFEQQCGLAGSVH